MLIILKLATILIVPLIRLPFKQMCFFTNMLTLTSLLYRRNITLAFVYFILLTLGRISAFFDNLVMLFTLEKQLQLLFFGGFPK